jgi:hypothetical protein
VSAPSYERVLWSPARHAVITTGDALVQLWERDAPASAFRAIQEHLVARAEASPGRPLWMLAVSGERSAMPDGEARRISATFPDHFTAFVLVIEGTGFRASAGRAVMTSMALMARRRSTPHVVANVTEGARWLASQTAGALDAAQLIRVVAQARHDLAAG